MNSLIKIYERLMYNRVYKFFERLELLYDKQFGFLPKPSTIDALGEVIEKLRRQQKSEILIFFLGLKKAFDTIDTQIQLKKLASYGTRGFALK